MRLLRYYILLVGLLAAREGRAQREFVNWRFGSGVIAGPPGRFHELLLSFGSSGPVMTESLVDQHGSSVRVNGTTISDATGRLLFSCDDNALFDADGRLLPDGRLNVLTQADQWWSKLFRYKLSIIAPSPGRPGCYHVFYWDKAADPRRGVALRYAVVDMRLNAGRGGIAERGGPVAHTPVPRVLAVRHANNRDFWILTRDEDTRGFAALSLTPRGVAAAPVVSLAGQAQYPHCWDLQVAPDGRHLATGGVEVLGRTANSPGTAQASVCLYDFDPATGVVSREQVLRRVAHTAYGTDGQGRPIPYESLLYAASFSPDGRKLYTAESGPFPILQNSRRFSDIWQYDLSQPSTAAIAASRFLVSNVSTPRPAPVDTTIYPTALQLTPTGEIWSSNFEGFAHFNPATGRHTPSYAAVVRYPNVAGAGCGFVRQGFASGPGQLFDTFPNVIPNMLYAPAVLNHEAGCPEDSVQFWASSAGDPAGLRWDFGEPAAGAANAARGAQAAHRYAQGGTYAVRLTLADGRVLTQAVTVAAQAGDFTNANVFTPNADGLNDAFVPVRAPLPGGRLQVFGRWGQAVFATTDPALRWDGAGAPGGEYFYYLEYPDCQGTTRRRRGTVTLVR